MTATRAATFTAGIVPPKASAQRKRLDTRRGRFRFFKAPDYQAAERLLVSLAKVHRPRPPLRGALAVTVCWVWPHPKSAPAKARALTLRHTRRPDLDNLTKLLLDSLAQAGWFKDDSQVSDLHLSKRYGPHPHIHVYAEEIPDTAT